MAKPPTPLSLHTEILFKDKVPLAKRHEIVEHLNAAMREALLTVTLSNGESLDDLIESGTTYCQNTNQELQLKEDE